MFRVPTPKALLGLGLLGLFGLLSSCGTDTPFTRGPPLSDAGLVAVVDGGGSVSFKGDIDPLFVSRCLACHAGSAGSLKLVGSPSADLVEARKFINAADPSQSPLVLKPTGQVSHGGGTVVPPDSDPAKLLLLWIEAGAQDN